MITKKDIIDYVMSTPHNANPSVLNSMLDAFYTSMISQEHNLADKDGKQLKSSEGFYLKSKGQKVI